LRKEDGEKWQELLRQCLVFIMERDTIILESSIV
jgi:hypothetical protein